MTFEKMEIDEEIKQILKKKGIEKPTEIQQKTIIPAIQGKDIIGESATGSGKTLAFSIPIIQKLSPTGQPKALILTPTRELAQQITKVVQQISKNTKIKTATVYGGESIYRQIDEIKTSDIIIGTPGRVLDHLRRRTLNLGNIQFLVLDEADRMLDMGFINDVEKIISFTPKERQTMMFSATMPRELQKITEKHMRMPTRVKTANEVVDPAKLKQVFYETNEKDKFSLLVHLLRKEKSNLVLVFCNTKIKTDQIEQNLIAQGFNAMALHGDLRQNQRTKVLEKFHKSEKFILVCTDVAARGLDIPNVSHVYNYNVPRTSTDYIHRIGRTARAGKEGKAIILLAPKDHDDLRRILKDKRVNIERSEADKVKPIKIQEAIPRRDSMRNRGSRDNRSRTGERRGRVDRDKKGRDRNKSNRSNRDGARRYGDRDNRDRDNRNRDNRNRSDRPDDNRNSRNEDNRNRENQNENKGYKVRTEGARNSPNRNNNGTTTERKYPEKKFKSNFGDSNQKKEKNTYTERKRTMHKKKRYVKNY